MEKDLEKLVGGIQNGKPKMKLQDNVKEEKEENMQELFPHQKNLVEWKENSSGLST